MAKKPYLKSGDSNTKASLSRGTCTATARIVTNRRQNKLVFIGNALFVHHVTLLITSHAVGATRRRTPCLLFMYSSSTTVVPLPVPSPVTSKPHQEYLQKAHCPLPSTLFDSRSCFDAHPFFDLTQPIRSSCSSPRCQSCFFTPPTQPRILHRSH